MSHTQFLLDTEEARLRIKECLETGRRAATELDQLINTVGSRAAEAEGDKYDDLLCLCRALVQVRDQNKRGRR